MNSKIKTKYMKMLLKSPLKFAKKKIRILNFVVKCGKKMESCCNFQTLPHSYAAMLKVAAQTCGNYALFLICRF